jgi:prepilin-type N-terminal cleavage/methylation domain-containing protein
MTPTCPTCLIRRAPRAFTLVEVTVTVIILGLIGATVAPIIFGAGEAYTTASTVRRTAEKSAYAMERVIRLLRDAPPGPTRGTVNITTAGSSQVRYADGRGIELTGTTLYERFTDGTTSPLCEGVSGFTIAYLRDDGQTSSTATPADTQRFNVTLICNSFELRSSALARTRVVDP